MRNKTIPCPFFSGLIRSGFFSSFFIFLWDACVSFCDEWQDYEELAGLFLIVCGMAMTHSQPLWPNAAGQGMELPA